MTAMSPVPAVRPGHLTLGHHPEWEQIADLFATLSHPMRVRILELLADQPCTGAELVAALGLPPARVSRQLAVLRQSGLLGCAGHVGSRHWALLDPSVLEVLSQARAVLRAAPADVPASSRSRTIDGAVSLTGRPTGDPTTKPPSTGGPATPAGRVPVTGRTSRVQRSWLGAR